MAKIPERERKFHWHSVYKLSTVSSPTEETSVDYDVDANINESMDGKRLSLLSSNMQAEEETMLRSFLTTKLNKMDEMDYTSSILSIEPNYFVQDVPTQIYFKVVSNRTGNMNQHDVWINFLICFVAATASGLELYQQDLDLYCDALLPHLEKYMESVDISEYLKLLETWYETNLCFVERCLNVFSDDLAVLICAGFSCDSVTFDEQIGVEVKNDVERLIECCGLSKFFMEINAPAEASLSDLVTLNNPKSIRVSVDQRGNHTISEKWATTFCMECVTSMQQLKSGDPIKMRQLLENYKLKSVQDMNTFKRYIIQAEKDYYALYRSYVFLITCGNGSVLLQNAKLQNSIDNLPNTKEVMETLQVFINKMGGLQKLDTSENKLSLKNKLNW